MSATKRDKIHEKHLPRYPANNHQKTLTKSDILFEGIIRKVRMERKIRPDGKIEASAPIGIWK